MAEISRREVLKQSAATSAAAAFLPIAAREMQMNPLGMPIGSQTWPHRQRIKDGDFAGLCRDMAALGIGSIELCSPGYPEFAGLADAKHTRKIIEDHGLTCPSAHFTLDELRTWPAAGDRLGPRHRHDADGHCDAEREDRERRRHDGRREASWPTSTTGSAKRRRRPGCSSSCTTKCSRWRRSTGVSSTRCCSNCSIRSWSRCSSRCPP